MEGITFYMWVIMVILGIQLIVLVKMLRVAVHVARLLSALGETFAAYATMQGAVKAAAELERLMQGLKAAKKQATETEVKP